MSLSIQLITVSIITIQIEYKHQLIGTRNAFNQYYDYIVVGAGSAGSVVANRLAENPNINVLLLEAGRAQSVVTDTPGTWYQLLGSEFDWNYTTVRQNNFGLAMNGKVPINRGKVLGGSGAINSLIYNRGNRRDFDNWEKTFGAKGWSYAEVLPLFIKSEANSDIRLVAQNPGFHGTRGPIGISSDPNPQPIILLYTEAMNELGFETVDVNGAKQLGTFMPQFFINNCTGMRASTANAYIDPNPYPNNLHILLNAFVVKILFSKANEELKAIGVQFIRDNTLHEVMAKREVIISAGAINSPQLLMLSGIGPKQHLNDLGIELIADLPVGHNLQDHPYAVINTVIKDTVRVDPLPELNIQQLYQLYVNHSGPLTPYPTGYTYYKTKSNPMPEWPNSIVNPQIYPITPALYADYTNRSNEWIEYFRPYAGKISLQLYTMLYRIRSYGSLRLVSSNPYDYPLIDPKYLSNPQDFEDMVQTIKFGFYYLINSSLSKYVYIIPKPIPGCHMCPNRYFYECDQYIRCLIRQLGNSFYHSVGTCRMGSLERSDVVVSERLKVKGIRAVRVCDASVMPQITNGNTNAPTIMIGEKCAEMIKQDHLFK